MNAQPEGKAPIEHERIEFVRFGPNGSEEHTAGYIWGQAPPVKGMRCYWVLEVTAGGLVAPKPAVAVVVAPRRHRIGRAARSRSGRAMWLNGGGRYVDVGTAYTETDERSGTGSLTHKGANPAPPPDRIVVEPLDPGTFARLSGDMSAWGLLQ